MNLGVIVTLLRICLFIDQSMITLNRFLSLRAIPKGSSDVLLINEIS